MSVNIQVAEPVVALLALDGSWRHFSECDRLDRWVAGQREVVPATAVTPGDIVVGIGRITKVRPIR